ncbi:hypothetical protein Asp14428_71310 [Actinoplanes sp. NBRC 14428]|nr:hypothetical protein Asp14428_71310 [Actinoplanes sp. NBRC 14428]
MLLVVVIAVTATVAAGVYSLQEQIRRRTLDSALQGVVIISSLVIDRNITLHDLTDELHPANRAQLDTDLVLLQQKGRIHGLLIWSLPAGRLAYADPAHERAGPLDDARRATVPLDRPTARGTADVDTGEPLLEVDYPYDANGDGIVDGLAVFLLPRGDVDTSIARSTRLLYGGGILVLLAALAGVLQVRRRQRAQDHAAVHDPLTGLGNREKLRRAAASALAGASAQQPVALLVLDLDGFKEVNDTLGHHAGDLLLAGVAQEIERVVRGGGTVTRLGGDEFAVLLPRTGTERALAVAAAVGAAVRRPVLIEDRPVAVGVSIGVAVAPGHGRDLSTLLQRGDAAMYRAKKGDGGVVAYEDRIPAIPSQVVSP